MVRETIARVPQGNDYIILDRCAGTGNLEKRLTDEELSHCIVSTIEYYEYKVLLELLGSKVRYGIYQIFAELNTFTQDEITGANIPDYPELNGHLKSLKQKVKEYYNSEIVPVLFKYEFLK